MQAEFERRRLRVYLAGPISKGNTVENIWNGIRWGTRMLQDGLAPYIPHLDAYLTLNAAANFTGNPDEPSDQWRSLLEWDLEWVAASEAFFRIPGESKGADLEMKTAVSLGIPVYTASFVSPGIPDAGYQGLLSYAAELALDGVRV